MRRPLVSEYMFSLVLIMVKNITEAKLISEKLVSEKLAACVSMVPNITSIYRWRGKIEKASEIMLLAKTSAKKLNRLILRIKELHSYEVPEILVFRINRGVSEYLKWVEKSLV